MLRSNLQVHDNGFVFAHDLGLTFTTNGTGVQLLKMLQQNLPKDQIRSTIISMFGISAEDFDIDFQDFMMQLKQLKLLL